MTNPPGAMPPLPTHEELELFAAEMVRSEQLLWMGFRKDDDGLYTIPSISPAPAKLAFAFAQAYAAPLIARVAELQADARRYQWLKERLLAADFAWGDPATCVWVFETDAPISADLDASIDAATAAKD